MSEQRTYIGKLWELDEWVPGIDSHISVAGLQEDENINWRVRKLIGENM